MIDEDFTKSLLDKHSYLSPRESIDCFTIECPDSELVSFAKSMRDDEGFEILIDLTAIDHGEGADCRFSTVVHLYSLVHRGYVRIHSLCLDNDKRLCHQFLKFIRLLIGMSVRLSICSESTFRIIQT